MLHEQVSVTMSLDTLHCPVAHIHIYIYIYVKKMTEGLHLLYQIYNKTIIPNMNTVYSGSSYEKVCGRMELQEMKTLNQPAVYNSSE